MNSWVEIRHIRYFLAVAEAQSFTRGAERLAVTQSSVSQQIKDLENRLGTPLFVRFGQRVRLTEAGTLFRRHAQGVMHKLDEGCRAVSNVAGLVTGHLDIGVIPALHSAWIPKVLEHIARDYPSLTVAVHERASSIIETEIELGHFDCGLGITSRISPNLRYEKLIAEKLALIVPPQHAHARRRSLAVRELKGIRLALLPESFDMRRAVNAIFQRARLRPEIAFEIGTIDSTLRTVLRAGIPTILPPIVLEGREAFGLRAVRLSGRIPYLQFGLIRPSARASSPATRVLAEFLKQETHSGRRPISAG
jgi:LysR family cyn operon transcriptional activator